MSACLDPSRHKNSLSVLRRTASSNPQRVPCLRQKCTACNRLHHFANVFESRHSPLPSQFQDTVSPHTADVNGCSLAPVYDLVAADQDIAISCMCTTSPPTVVTPSPNPISQMSCCPHSPPTPRSGSKIHIQRAGTSVAPSSGSEHAARIACSCPVDVDAGANAVPFALCRIFQNRRSAVESDILSSFFPSLFFFSDLIVFGLKGREDDTHCTMQCVRYDVRPHYIRLLVQRK